MLKEYMYTGMGPAYLYYLDADEEYYENRSSKVHITPQYPANNITINVTVNNTIVNNSNCEQLKECPITYLF